MPASEALLAQGIQLISAALCAISKLNPNWLRRLVNSGEALDGQNDELRIKMWRDDQQDESKWLEPILVETEQVVKFEEAMAMKSVDGLGWWDVGSTHNGAKSTETGWSVHSGSVLVGYSYESNADRQVASGIREGSTPGRVCVYPTPNSETR